MSTPSPKVDDSGAKWRPPRSSNPLGMDIGAMLRARRIDLGLTQEEAGSRAGVRLRDVSRIEQGDDLLVTNYCLLAGTLGMRLTIKSRGESVPLGDAQVLDRVVPRAPEADLVGALEEALKRRKRTGVHLLLDYRYAQQVRKEVWGAGSEQLDWEDLPTWKGVPVSLAHGMGDTIKLVRNSPSRRWQEELSRAYAAPRTLSQEEMEAYRQLRLDGHDEQNAERIALVL